MNNKSAGVWVKSSERMPEQGGGYFARSNIQNDFREPFILEYNGQSLHDIEWLDESQQPDNSELIEALGELLDIVKNEISLNQLDKDHWYVHEAKRAESILNQYKRKP